MFGATADGKQTPNAGVGREPREKRRPTSVGRSRCRNAIPFPKLPPRFEIITGVYQSLRSPAPSLGFICSIGIPSSDDHRRRNASPPPVSSPSAEALAPPFRRVGDPQGFSHHRRFFFVVLCGFMPLFWIQFCCLIFYA